MRKNDYTIDFRPNSADRSTAKSILEYSFFFNFCQNDIDINSSNLLENIFLSCHKQGSLAFWSGNTHQISDLFGCCTHSTNLIKIISKYQDQDSDQCNVWGKLIFHECIMSLYHAMIKTLFSDPASEYEVGVKIMDQGINASLLNNKYEFDKNSGYSIPRANYPDGQDTCIAANAFMKKSASHKKALSNYSGIFFEGKRKIRVCEEKSVNTDLL